MRIDFEVSGLAELDQSLQNIGVAAGAKALRKAGRQAMAGVQFAMSMGAGFDRGNEAEHMREAIKMRSKIGDSRAGHSNAVAVRVGPTKKHARKAIAQEYGTANQAPAPFMRPALFENREHVANTFKTILATAIENAS